MTISLTWQDKMAQSMPKPLRELPGLCRMYCKEESQLMKSYISNKISIHISYTK